MLLKGKTAIITGAGSGVGRALALGFARAGARIACVGRRAALLTETRQMIEAEGGSGLAIPADVTDAAQVQAMVEQTLAAYGQIDVLFNNAGSFASVAPIWEADPALWWRDVTTNLLGSMLCARAVLPHMMARNAGVIFNMDGGGGAGAPNLGGSGYGCSKAALLRFTEGLARELEAVGSAVLVFALNPGFVRTEMTEALVANPAGLQWLGFVKTLLETGAGHQPGDCAAAALKLLAIAGVELNGCTFSVETDFEAVDRQRGEMRTGQRYVLRLRY